MSSDGFPGEVVADDLVRAVTVVVERSSIDNVTSSSVGLVEFKHGAGVLVPGKSK